MVLHFGDRGGGGPSLVLTMTNKRWTFRQSLALWGGAGVDDFVWICVAPLEVLGATRVFTDSISLVEVLERWIKTCNSCYSVILTRISMVHLPKKRTT